MKFKTCLAHSRGVVLISLNPISTTINTIFVHRFDRYEPGFWYYEIFVLIKKMLLTGAIMVIAPGSSAQLLIAILIVLFFMLSVLKMGPFEADADYWLSFCTSLQCE